MAKAKLKQKDLVILSHLRQQGRATLTKISRKTSIPVTTIYERLKKHQSGVIRKHTLLLDFKKLGYNIITQMLFGVEIDQKTEFGNVLKQKTQVNSVLRINNGYDFIVEGVFRQVHDVEKFIEELESEFNITRKKSYYVLEDLKREGFMCDPTNPIIIK